MAEETPVEPHHHNNKWYLQDDEGEPVGPFTTGQVQRWVLLERISPESAVSPDDVEWGTIEEFADELIPEVMKADLSEPFHRDRLEAARRWADERQEDGDEYAGFERRADPRREEVEMRRLHQRVMEATANRPREHAWWLVFIFAVIGVAVYFTFFHEAEERDPITCEAEPAAGVNWQGCDKSGLRARNADLAGARLRDTDLTRANLAGADLSGVDARYAVLELATLTDADLGGAVLLGANLRRADLRRATLVEADLSYADLTDASLAGADMRGIRLHRAIWVDGQPCGPGSVGECLR